MNTKITFKARRQGACSTHPRDEQRPGYSRYFVPLSIYSATTCLLALTLVGCDPSPSDDLEASTDATGIDTGSTGMGSGGTTTEATMTGTSTTDASTGTTGSSTATGDTTGSSSSTSTGDETSDSGTESTTDDTSSEPCLNEMGSENIGNANDFLNSMTIPATDVGYYAHAFNTSTTLQSFHWESPAGEHKSYFTGNQATPTFNVERRPYYVFDLVGINGVVSAKLRYFAWKPALSNANSGAYESGDNNETVFFRSVDSHSAEQIMNAPYNDTQNHTLDLPIWTDLGDGDDLACRIHTIADETADLIPSPTTDPNTDCSVADTACGKWIEVKLNATALAQINSANGLWIMGAHMTSIGYNSIDTHMGKEWVNNGTIADLSPDKAPHPDFLTPLPELVLAF